MDTFQTSGSGERRAVSGSRSRPPTLLDFVNAWVKRLPAIFASTLILVLGAGIFALLRPLDYTAEATFVPEARRIPQLNALSGGLLGQLGVGLNLDQSESPRFYLELLRSREVSEALLTSRFPATEGDSATLLDLWEVRGDSPRARIDRGLRMLRSHLAASVQGQTGIITVAITERDPVLAAAVSNRLVELVHVFNLQRRRSSGGERVRFVESRVEEARHQLGEAEKAMEAFLTRNRQFETSPQLQFEYERLQRQVELQQELYLTLSRELETARIETVNDTPLITVIDEAVPPTKRRTPRVIFATSIALALGLSGSVLWVLIAGHAEREDVRSSQAYRDLRARWHRLKGGRGTAPED